MGKALVRIRQEQIGEHTEAVNARELHDFLGSRQEFANWIKRRIAEYGFTEGQDYLVFKPVVDETGRVFDNSIKNPRGGRLPTEYLVTIDMAKELSMVERTERGRQARRYFIEAEKRLRQLAEDTVALERQDGARAMARVLDRARRYGRGAKFVNQIVMYRRMGLSQRETGRLLEVNKDTVREYESLLKGCGFAFAPVRPHSRRALAWEVR